MRTRLKFIWIMLAILATGCSSSVESPEPAGEAVATTQVATASVVSDLYSDGVARIVKTANYRFEVKDIRKSIDAIEVAIRKHNGFISFSDLRLEEPLLEGRITIRVPQDHFQELLKEIDHEAYFFNIREVKSEDVSKQFVDLESRLKSKREVEQRYMEILRKKAGSIEELLQAEKQIGELHEEIEATVSRINYLRDEVRYSTVNLELYQRVEDMIAGSESTALSDMQQALVSGWRGLLIVFTAALYLWPVIVLVAVGSILYRTSARKPRLSKGN